MAGEITEACAWGASEHGCDVDVRDRGALPRLRAAHVLAGARPRRGGPARRRAASRQRVAIGGGSDANALRLDGFDCVLLANGTDGEPHARRARVGGATSTTMLEVCEGIVAAAAGCGAVSGRLKLRRGVVVGEEPLTVEVDGERRPAWADEALLGEMREGDEVVVNVAALDLGLGSGGFDVVHVNLTRGLEAPARGRASEHVIKLNYTSLQHPVEPVERRLTTVHGSGVRGARGTAPRAHARSPVLVLPLHGHLAPAAWAAAQAASGLGSATCRPGAGRCRGRSRRDVAELRERGLLCGHITAAPAYGGEHEAISVAGALDAARRARLGRGRWSAPARASSAPTPSSATAAWRPSTAPTRRSSLGLPTLLSPRLSAADPRERHVDVSHHTYTVLELLLAPVDVAGPRGRGADRRRARGGARRHRLRSAPRRPRRLRGQGLPGRTMGRDLEEDPLFFAAPLAAGRRAAATRPPRAGAACCGER